MRFSYGMVLVLTIMLVISIDRLKEIKKIPAIVSSVLMLLEIGRASCRERV